MLVCVWCVMCGVWCVECVRQSGLFGEQAYGAVVMDRGSYMWVVDANSTTFHENSEDVFAGGPNTG